MASKSSRPNARPRCSRPIGPSPSARSRPRWCWPTRLSRAPLPRRAAHQIPRAARAFPLLATVERALRRSSPPPPDPADGPPPAGGACGIRICWSQSLFLSGPGCRQTVSNERSPVRMLLGRANQHHVLLFAIVAGHQDLRAAHAFIARADIADEAVERDRAAHTAAVEIPNFDAGFLGLHLRPASNSGIGPECVKQPQPRLVSTNAVVTRDNRRATGRGAWGRARRAASRRTG